MAVGQASQPFSSPRPRALPTVGPNQDPAQAMAKWASQISANVRNVAPQATPQNFTVSNAQGALNLKWGQVLSGSGADGYEILKSQSGTFKTDLQIIPISHVNQTSYTDNFATATKCSYRIRTTSGTPQTPQSARGPESGVVAHTSINTTDTATAPTTVRDMRTTDKSRAGARLGNYGAFKPATNS